MKLEELTKDERSLLLFLETQAVDYGGVVDVAHMNRDDFAIAERWKGSGLIEFGRIASACISRSPAPNRMRPTHWVHLSDEAFALAHEERKARSARMWERRKWMTVEERRKEEAAEGAIADYV